jgi:endonuclease/exonuclease/phosphatase family metal-dependent hydrolase
LVATRSPRRLGARLSVTLAFALALLWSAAVPGGADATSLRAMTYNAHWAEQTSARTGHWTGRLDLARIAKEIRSSGARVVFLQELHTYRVGHRRLSEANELARMLGWTRGGVRFHAIFRTSKPLAIWCRRATGEAVVKHINGRPARCIGHGNAILSRTSLARGQFLDLFRPDDDLLDGDLYGTREGRGALRASLVVDGTSLWLATVHLAREPSVGGCQLRDLLPQLASFRPLVFAGDFNMELTTESQRPRCAGLPVRPLDQVAPSGLVHGEPGGRTYPAYRPVEAIDHFFASPPLILQRVRPQNNCYRGRCSSDHLPLVATISMPPSSGIASRE